MKRPAGLGVRAFIVIAGTARDDLEHAQRLLRQLDRVFSNGSVEALPEGFTEQAHDALRRVRRSGARSTSSRRGPSDESARASTQPCPQELIALEHRDYAAIEASGPKSSPACA